MPTNAHAHQPVCDIPRVSVERFLDSEDALPTGRHQTIRSRPVIAGGIFTAAEIAVDYDAHLHPDTVFVEQLHSAVVYVARNQPERIPLGWMRTLIHEARTACAERLGLYDVDCHACKRSVFVRDTADACPSCHGPHSTSEADLTALAIEVLRASSMVRS